MIHIALIDDNPTDIDIGKQYLKAYFKGRCDAANMEINVHVLHGRAFFSCGFPSR